MAYCTVTEVKTYAGTWSPPAGITDPNLTTLIDLVEEMINKFTNDDFNENSVELTIDGSGSEVLWIAKFTPLRCIEVTSIQDVDTNETYDPSYYEVYDRTIVMAENPEIRAAGYLTGGKWPKGHKNIRITGKFGWSSIPEPIKRAAILFVRMLAENEGSGSGAGGLKVDMKSEKIGDYSYTKDKDKQWGDSLQRFTGDLEIDTILQLYQNEPIQPLDSGDDI